MTETPSIHIDPEPAASAASRMGRAAYEAYITSRYSGPRPSHVRSWEELSVVRKTNWEAAAGAAVAHRMGIAQEALLPAASLCLGAAGRLAAMAGVQISPDLEVANAKIADVEQPAYLSPLDVAGHAMGQMLNTLEAVLHLHGTNPGEEGEA